MKRPPRFYESGLIPAVTWRDSPLCCLMSLASITQQHCMTTETLDSCPWKTEMLSGSPEWKTRLSEGSPRSSTGKKSTCNAGNPGSVPGLGRFPGEGIGYPFQYSWAFLVALGKELTCNAGNLGSIPGLGRFPGGGHGNPLQYSCLENPHGHRSLESSRSWGHKKSDMTERLTLSTACIYA